VLSAFQQVEDGLAEVRILSKEIQQEQQAVESAQTYLKLEQARYDTGVDPYLFVLIAQTTVLADQQTLNDSSSAADDLRCGASRGPRRRMGSLATAEHAAGDAETA
jgi:outer membrane protein TolC